MVVEPVAVAVVGEAVVEAGAAEVAAGEGINIKPPIDTIPALRYSPTHCKGG